MLICKSSFMEDKDVDPFMQKKKRTFGKKFLKEEGQKGTI